MTRIAESTTEDKRGIPWMNIIGFALLGAAYVGSLTQMYRTEREVFTKDTTVMMLVHRQLELGAREALQVAIEEYQDMRRGEGMRVKIIQNPIPGRGYGQFMRTSMMGGMLPDIFQWGGGAPDSASDVSRHYYPISKYVREPNPYNEGTELEGVEWRSTFVDSLRNSFHAELQEYYTVGFNTWTVRMFYNHDLLKEITGLEEPPLEYERFLDLCGEIRAYSQEHNREIIPLASSSNSFINFHRNLIPTLEGDLVVKLDYNWDGEHRGPDRIYGYLNDDYDWAWTKDIIYAHEATRRLAEHFMPGFMAVANDEAVRQLVQGRAIFLVAGVGEAPSLKRLADFDLRVSHFPIPSAAHPKYGPYFDGRRTERHYGISFTLGITRNCSDKAEAVNFLQYMTSQKVDEWLCQEVGWVPAIKGAEVDPFLEPFRPHMTGRFNPELLQIDYSDRGEMYRLESQIFWPYISGKCSYEEYVARLEERYNTAASKDLKFYNEERRRNFAIAKFNRIAMLGRRMSREQQEGRSGDYAKFSSIYERYMYQLWEYTEDWVRLDRLFRDLEKPKAQEFAHVYGKTKDGGFHPYRR